MKLHNLPAAALAFLMLGFLPTGKLAADCEDEHTEYYKVPNAKMEYQVLTTRDQGTKVPIATPGGSYNPDKDRFRPRGEKEFVNAQGYFNNRDPFQLGEDGTQGTWKDRVIVGETLMRITSAGGLYMKGWMGSDEFDSLSFQIPMVDTKWTRRNTWDPPDACRHGGTATLEQEMYCHTMVKTIGGFAGGGGSAGSIQPFLNARNIVRNVAGGDTDLGVIQYNHQVGSVASFSASGSGGLSLAGPDGSLGISPAFNLPSENCHLYVYAKPLVDRAGDAENPAEIEARNSAALSLFTNDTIVAWDLHIVIVEQRLDIYHGTSIATPDAGYTFTPE